MRFQIAICSPIPERITAARNLCREYFQTRNEVCKVTTFSRFEELLHTEVSYDLYLISLTTPAKGQTIPEGLKIVQLLRAKGMIHPVIFVAASPKWAYDAFRVDALQYLPSPLQREALFSALDRAVEPEHGPIFALRTNHGICGIPFSEIESVECTDHVLHFHRIHQSTLSSVTLRIPLNQAIERLLADKRFLQPHRSYVINLSQVARICPAEFEMKSGDRIPIPRGRFSQLKAAYLAFVEACNTPPALS